MVQSIVVFPKTLKTNGFAQNWGFTPAFLSLLRAINEASTKHEVGTLF
jgi:hypothetical protein